MRSRAILRKECRELWREGRVKGLAILLLLLLGATLVTSYQYSQRLRQEHATALLADRDVWEHQPEKNPHSAAHFGFYLFKPVYPLSLFEPGIDRYIGATLYLEAHKRNTEQFSAIADGSDLARFGFLSPSFILQFLLPLLLIVAGFNSVSREKENGNLALLLSQGGSVRQLYGGKWLALYALVLVVVLPVFGLCLLALLSLKAAPPQYAAAVGLLGLYLVFYAITINIVLLISGKVRQSGQAFLYCILFWMGSTFFFPKLASTIADQASPLLTNEQIVQTVKGYNQARGGNIHALGGKAYKKLVDTLLTTYGVDSVSQLPVNMAGIRLDAGEQMDTRNYERITELQAQRLNRQQQLITMGSVLSPLIPSQQLSMALANTDVYSHHAFTDSAEQYRRVFVNRLNRYIAYESGLQEGYTTFKAGKKVWLSIPRFTYQSPGLSVLSRYGWSLLALLFWLLLSGALLLRSIQRFQPTT
jgi:ABC-2 type transport system permease protein